MQERERRLISWRCHKNRTHPALIMIMFYSLPLSLSSFLQMPKELKQRIEDYFQTSWSLSHGIDIYEVKYDFSAFSLFSFLCRVRLVNHSYKNCRRSIKSVAVGPFPVVRLNGILICLFL